MAVFVTHLLCWLCGMCSVLFFRCFSVSLFLCLFVVVLVVLSCCCCVLCCLLWSSVVFCCLLLSSLLSYLFVASGYEVSAVQLDVSGTRAIAEHPIVIFRGIPANGEYQGRPVDVQVTEQHKQHTTNNIRQHKTNNKYSTELEATQTQAHLSTRDTGSLGDAQPTCRFF